MMLTEEQARKKWCPLARGPRLLPGVGTSESCIGSECMAWRFAEVEYATVKASDGKGWCGLAGMPAP